MSDSLIVPCSSCGTLNRVPRARLGDVPVCSSCRAHLLDREPHDVDAKNFAALVGKSDLPVVVDFWAAWCGPCQMMAPQFAAAARHLVGEAILVKVDTEAQQGIAAQHGIRSIPTMIVFRRGQELARTSGASSADQIAAWVRSVG
ncbi:MAG: thioredoxin TrxC [Planctomycetota bacterium]|nr:thioredoxin TrxC [Planctomycetota bacterium]MDA0933546.1 thioredoxin TrxC [Planctomycetota bacterium]MDA1221234.1 thioredoxin TrxC [Planctomycetota bacterium]